MLLLCCVFLSGFQVEVTLPKTLDAPQTGRLLLMLAKSDASEPRAQIQDGPNCQLIYGENVSGWKPGEKHVFDAGSFGFPISAMQDIPAGQYWVQVLLNRYEAFHLKNGKTVWLPPDRGEGQQWHSKPGNVYSKPQKVDWKPGISLQLELSETIPEIEAPKDSEWVKHIRIKSNLLSDFWGRDMYLGAHVLLPKDWAKHPDAKYPLMVFHGHFPSDFGGFRTEPPDADLKPVYSERFHLEGYNKIVQAEAYQFYQTWISENFPRFLIVEIQHANPYYDDSYAVNSANLGPYGDAINFELIPEIEKQFRGIGEGWARFLYGGSTGGWEALATQVFYPDLYNGCFAACPDPVDFRAYCTVNLYKDENAYFYPSDFQKLEIPAKRDYLGHTDVSVRANNHLELVLGDRSRSGGQWDIWEAVYSPQGADGYPKRIWDKKTGVIDKEVATYWREHYDLSAILNRDWDKLAPKLYGKIH
ncbi:MAG: hypothetical protein KDC71_20580, partial [Acidobacteria bacterium]|nr:hypothetical protein [Acidobacteriota bacterium]